jgi:murein DD-endopeptidase MepM/ murein hydrolase activator NlpD
MKRLALLAALVLTVTGGTARADVFAVVPDGAAGPAVLPSAETPNTPGSLMLPVAWTERSMAAPTISYPQLQALWQRAGAAYRIPWQVLAAINKVETNFGGNMGPSSAGAVGWMQFMPDTWLRWGVDASGDGIADPWNADDAIYAAARYLAAAGGATDLERGVFAYNHADWYVREVLDLAAAYGGGVVPDVSFAADRLQLQIGQAQAVVEAQEEKIEAAQRRVDALAAVERGLLTRAASAQLLSDELALRHQAGAAGARRVAAEAVVERLQLGLGEAQSALAAVQTGSVAGAVVPTGTAGYVFPVAGGPGVVSVSHTHHDYPSADIAAPEGTQLYALADGVVESSWAAPNGKCGIGLKLATVDGQLWTYCHLSVLDPTAVPGAALPAGAPVGLVGHTGHATGPHLHLGLDPTTSYPQDQEWFRAFAGTAFTWQDADPTPEAPLFAVVAEPEAVYTFTR